MKDQAGVSLKKRILGLSLRKKFLLSYLLIIVFTCALIGTVSVTVSSEYLKKKALDSSSQLNYQVLLNVDYRSATFEKLAYHMISATRFQQVAHNHREERDRIDDYRDASSLGSIVSETTISNADIMSIDILMKSGTVFSWRKGNPKLSINALEGDKLQQKTHFAGLLQQQPSGMVWRSTPDAQIEFGKRIIDNDNLSDLGAVIFEVNADHFRLSLPDQSSLVDPANIAVLNKDGNTVVSAKNPMIAPLVDYVLEQRTDGVDLRNQTFAFAQERYMMVQANAPSSKWQVLCFVPLRDIWKDVTVITYSVLIAALVCLVSAGLLAWFFSSSITRNINLLQETVQKVEDGNFSVRVEPESYDEIGKLGLQFNFMVEKINTLIRDVADERVRRQAKEYEVLQTQINPHFLYNTLGSIRCLAQLNQQPDIEKMITCLVEILKAALNKNGQNWRLGEELAYVDHYVALQKIRYANHFSVEYLIAEETEDLFIIGLILQPLVENTIYHGFELREPGGVISIESRIVEGKLKLWVRDNGSGMGEETLERLRSQPQKPYRGMNSIGITNVDERIKYCYGEGYGLSITSVLNQGTTVEITLPVIREELL